MHGRACKQFIFRSYDTSIFNAMSFDENPFTCKCKKEDKNAEGFQISQFYWSFLNGIMAAKWSVLSLANTMSAKSKYNQ